MVWMSQFSEHGSVWVST